MRLAPDLLHQHLEKTILPIYLLYGTELFLLDESVRLLRQHTESKLNAEWITITLGTIKTDTWSMLGSRFMERSLFSPVRCIHLRFNEKITAKETALLEKIAQFSNEFVFIVVQLGSLSRTQQTRSWFTTLAQRGAAVAHWPLTQNAFTQWVQRRLSRDHLQLSPDALLALCYQTEGNCLAAAQAIEQLRLEENTAPILQNQFNIFDLTSSLQKKDLARTIQILNALKTQGVAPTLVVWAMTQWATGAPSASTLLPRLSQLDFELKCGRQQEPWVALLDLIR